MRISDWSSDVCSSDLFVHEFLVGHRPAADSGHDGAVVVENEIGRASCRERVVSVRVDLGGRRIIKKKKMCTSKEAHLLQMNNNDTQKKYTKRAQNLMSYNTNTILSRQDPKNT